ncbi:MAG: HEAT repeat domain-containing protein [Spirochaetota bacterium]
MKKKFSGSIYLMVTLIFITIISCSSVYIKDDIGQNSPKGYISFYCNLNRFNIYRIDNNNEIKEVEDAIGKQEYRIAKAPGKYEFIFMHKDYIKNISVNVLQDMTSCVTIQPIYVSASSSTDTNYYLKSTTTITYLTYYIFTTVGTHPIPVLSENNTNKFLNEKIVSCLQDALIDTDSGTRIKAITELTKVKHQISSDTVNILQWLAANDRIKRVRKESADLLSSIGKSMEPEPFYLETFEKGYGWPDGNFNNYKMYINQFGFNIDNFKDDIISAHHWLDPSLERKKNYDIICDAIWKSGIKDQGFGFSLAGSDRLNKYNFLISRNGGAKAYKLINNKIDSIMIPWTNNPKTNINSDKFQRLKVEVRGNNYSYFVNDVKIGSFVSKEEDNCKYCIRMVVDGEQSVCFGMLKIIDRDSREKNQQEL